MTSAFQLYWRAMEARDLRDVSRLAAEIHRDYPESNAVLTEKFERFPDGCFMCTNGSDTFGYLLSHPWRRFDPPLLDTCLGQLPEAPECYYIHDLALAPAAQGLGMARLSLNEILRLTNELNLEVISLVAVSNSAVFWQHQHFQIHENPAISEKLRSYGTGAHYMEKVI